MMIQLMIFFQILITSIVVLLLLRRRRRRRRRHLHLLFVAVGSLGRRARALRVDSMPQEAHD